MSERLSELLKEEESCLEAFSKAKNGLEKVRSKMAHEKHKAEEVIKAKRAEQAEVLAKLQAEIDEEKKVIEQLSRRDKVVGKKIKSIGKIVG